MRIIKSLKKIPSKMWSSIKKVPKAFLSLPRRISNRIIWGFSHRRRMILRIFRQLKPLENVSQEMQQARKEVFQEVAFELKFQEQIEELRLFLDACRLPAGPEQIFAAAIYPVMLRYRLLAYVEPSEPNRLDIEIGYVGHMDEYYYWIVEVDGMSTEGIEQMLQPRQINKEGIISIAYRIPAAGYLEVEKDSSAVTLILKSRHLFLNILEDVKRMGYLITPAKHTSGTLWQRRISENAYQVRLIQHKQRREKLERALQRAR
ncbi:hypothetical protein FJZ31_22130 [Candidatus Poribacteria bacterium]|nr:hypothetical protein [Candidatus Poribacteria bacterium]